MSTNYYAKFTDKKFVARYFPEEFEEVKEGIYSTYLVHIGKRSNGWKPLFQSTPQRLSVGRRNVGISWGLC